IIVNLVCRDGTNVVSYANRDKFSRALVWNLDLCAALLRTRRVCGYPHARIRRSAAGVCHCGRRVIRIRKDVAWGYGSRKPSGVHQADDWHVP
ncbi:MAG: hypothetical protein IJ268_03520, partial [Proteobacteria bacterium]|nr:hypothetical protein [Pseudomonadota bacterium]